MAMYLYKGCGRRQPGFGVDMSIDRVLACLKRGDLPPEPVVSQICILAEELFMREANVQMVPAPVVLCGDIHGQFHDLLELFRVSGGFPDNHTNFLFMGDFVDRGFYSVETLLLILCLKVRYPDRICLIRGNHESRQISAAYGFYDECLRKYGSVSVWRMCCEVFDHMSLGALVGGPGGVFCIHGGLSPDVRNIDEISGIDRIQEVPHEGAMCDLLWSDPDESITSDWAVSSRGAGFLFGGGPVERFHHVNNTSLIARAHQLVLNGYNEMFDGKLVTVWSAPNYCYRCGNMAAVLELDENLQRKYVEFDTVEHPELDQVVPIRQPLPEYFL